MFWVWSYGCMSSSIIISNDIPSRYIKTFLALVFTTVIRNSTPVRHWPKNESNSFPLQCPVKLSIFTCIEHVRRYDSAWTLTSECADARNWHDHSQRRFSNHPWGNPPNTRASANGTLISNQCAIDNTAKGGNCVNVFKSNASSLLVRRFNA